MTCGFPAAGWWPGGSAGHENGLLTSRQLDVDDIKPGNAFKMAHVRRCDAPARGDGRGGNDAVVRSDVRAGRGECCPQAGIRAGRQEINKGIGKEIARQLADAGLTVYVAPGPCGAGWLVTPDRG